VSDDSSGSGGGAPAKLTAALNPYADPNAVAVPVVPKVC
jgi:hypothetical protein